LVLITTTIITQMLTNCTTAHFFQKESPLAHKETNATAQNHESPEWAKNAAIERNAPGFSATRIEFERRASNSRMERRLIFDSLSLSL
jgi:hypothetical protein